MVVKQRNIRSKSHQEPEYYPIEPPQPVVESIPAPQVLEPLPVQPRKQTSLAKFFFMTVFIFLLLTAAVGGTVWYVTTQLQANRFAGLEEEEEVKEKKPKAPKHEEKKWKNVSQKYKNESSSCVVTIQRKDKFNDENDLKGCGVVIYQGKGSDDQSLILTDYHIAYPDDGSECVLTVKNDSGESVEAYPISAAEKYGLVILAIPNIKGLKPVWQFRSSKGIKTGETVYTLVYSPKSSNFSVLEGTLSSKHYDKESQLDGAVLQHTAAAKEGNSGGPLLDSEGNIIGINTLAFSGGGNSYFAIPIEYLHDKGAWEWFDQNFISIINDIKIQ